VKVRQSALRNELRHQGWVDQRAFLSVEAEIAEEARGQRCDAAEAAPVLDWALVERRAQCPQKALIGDVRIEEIRGVRSAEAPQLGEQIEDDERDAAVVGAKRMGQPAMERRLLHEVR
jgi:hypothetical protein